MTEARRITTPRMVRKLLSLWVITDVQALDKGLEDGLHSFSSLIMSILYIHDTLTVMGNIRVMGVHTT